MAPKFLPQLSSLLQQTVNLLLPKVCLHCDSRIDYGLPFLCSDCFSRLPIIETVNCSFCGASYVDSETSSLIFSKCSLCTDEDYCFDLCRSAFLYSEIVQTLIHYFKYNEYTKIGSLLARQMISFIEERKPFANVDYVCPVPLHPVRKRERGYNQAEILAKRLSHHFGWEYSSDLVKRVKYTKSQTQLKGNERKQNVLQAFSVDRITDLQGTDILIVDDVFTTGATVNVISKELKHRKAKRVYVMTVARAGLLPYTG